MNFNTKREVAMSMHPVKEWYEVLLLKTAEQRKFITNPRLFHDLLSQAATEEEAIQKARIACTKEKYADREITIEAYTYTEGRPYPAVDYVNPDGRGSFGKNWNVVVA
jgi:hypothetical protein